MTYFNGYANGYVGRQVKEISGDSLEHLKNYIFLLEEFEDFRVLVKPHMIGKKWFATMAK